MLRSSQILLSVILCHSLVWNSSPTHHVYVHAFVGVAVDHRRISETKTRQATTNSCLNLHRFNGGYDPASPLTWTPQQAAEFTIFHEGSPQHAGMQLRTTIQHWSGADLAEFLTRLYLGNEVSDTTTSNNNNNDFDNYNNKKKLVFEPQNVRSPRWEGLDTREGIFALKDLLREALSKESLSAQEISRFAEEFLLKEYKWPSQIQEQSTSTSTSTSISSNLSLSNSQSAEVVFEQDSFYSSGHARTLARVLLAVRKERGYEEFNWNDIALMVTLPEKRDEDREVTPMKLIDFFRTISACIPLTATDKTNIVHRMAMSGWWSGSIPKFMVELLPAETMSDNHSVDEMSRLQGDSFFDFPAAATVRNVRQDQRDAAATIAATIAAAVAVAEETDEDQEIMSSKVSTSAEDTVQSEYEELVQSYWKKVEVPTTKTKRQTDNGYGVSKTKSIKTRTPEWYGMSKTKKSIANSVSP